MSDDDDGGGGGGTAGGGNAGGGNAGGGSGSGGGANFDANDVEHTAPNERRAVKRRRDADGAP
jgi:hypothetical protein